MPSIGVIVGHFDRREPQPMRRSVPSIGIIVGHLDRQEPQPLCGDAILACGCSAVLAAQEPQLLDGGRGVVRGIFCGFWHVCGCVGLGLGCL